LFVGVISVVAGSVAASRAHAQLGAGVPDRTQLVGVEDQRPADPLYPGAGRVSFTAASGLPFVALGEAAIGIGDRFALGVLAGLTPRVATFGTRLRAAPVELGRLRFSVVVPVLYYPRTNAIGGAPWMLLRASGLVEYAFDSGIRPYLGVGLVMASTLARIGRELGAQDYSDGAGGLRGYDNAKPSSAGLWGSLGAGVAWPLDTHYALFAEASLITEGLEPAGSSWVGGPPIVASIGFVARL
jgi:hypothetical protein